jgi:hypothetical protein
MVGLLVHRGDPAFVPPETYELSLGHAGQLFDLLASGLALAVGPRAGCVGGLAIIIMLTIGLAGHLADHLGRSRYAAWALGPVALGWALYWGFAAQMLGFALLVGALPLLDRAAAQGTRRSAVQASLATALVGFGHAASLLAACLATTVLALARPLDRRTVARLAPAAAGAALVLGEMRWEARTATPLAALMSSRVLWHPPGVKLRALAGNLIGSHGPLTELIFTMLTIVTAVIWRQAAADPVCPAPGQDPGPDRPRAGWLERNRFAVLAAAFFAVYLAAPYSVNFGAFLYVRFLPPAYALAMVLAAPVAGARSAMVVAPAAVLLATPVLAGLPQLAAAERQSAAVDPLIGQVERGGAAAVLHFGKHDRSLLFDPTAFGNRILGERGGRLLFSFAEYPIAPLRVRPERRWDSTLLRLYSRPASLCPATDLVRLRWVLVHVHDRALAPRIARAFAPEGELVDERGEWMLFRSTLAPAPAMAPDEAPPAGAETLQERVARARD